MVFYPAFLHWISSFCVILFFFFLFSFEVILSNMGRRLRRPI
jgi:hypothetical protein